MNVLNTTEHLKMIKMAILCYMYFITIKNFLILILKMP